MNKIIIAAIILCAAGLAFSLMLPGMYRRGSFLPDTTAAARRIPPQKAFPHPVPEGMPAPEGIVSPAPRPAATSAPSRQGAISGQAPGTAAQGKAPDIQRHPAPAAPAAPQPKAVPSKVGHPELPGMPSTAEKRRMAKKRTEENARLLGKYVTLPDGLTGEERHSFLEKLAASEMNGSRKGVITFGSYPQKTDKKEPIEWEVLVWIPDRYILLCSKHILECSTIPDGPVGKSWETSSLRRWLNEDFYEAAFSREEKDKIAVSRVLDASSEGAPQVTEDKVFVPCVNEIWIHSYFFGPDSKKCAPTKRASDERMATNPDTGFSSWWIRGEKGDGFRQISPAGFPASADALKPMAGARPFVWIKWTRFD